MPIILRRSRTRLVAAAAATSAALLGLVGLAPAAHADGSGTLTVVGTSDVFDSNLIQAVIKPGFEAAFPDVTLNYVSKGTGAAITFAEAGTASGLLVHAPSLENQFVDAGYSLNNKPGRAIFYGDYVLLGPADDPAGVMKGDRHNIVGAFKKIATAGQADHATFVSRGGTPGTTVQEHQIWAQTTGVTRCQMSDANGGGESPSTTTGDCPDTISYPSWYEATGLTQGPNILAGDSCNFPNGGCYVFTDRGTFDYLVSQHQITNLQIVTRNNGTANGNSLLVNTFHLYAVNPKKFTPDVAATINTTAAKEFLNWLQSPAAQAAVGDYLANNSDGAPFLPDAAPVVTSSAAPASVAAGKSMKIAGSITNVVPSTPSLGGVQVSLHSAPATNPNAENVVAKATTNSAGKFTLTYKPKQTRRYWVTTPQITKLEYPSLTPQFSDILAGAKTRPSKSVVEIGAVSVKNLKGGKGKVSGTAHFSPRVIGSHGVMKLYGARKANRSPHFIAEIPLSAGAASRKFVFMLSRAKWHLELRYANPGVIRTAEIKRTVTVG